MSWGEEQQKEIETIRERKITVKLSDADCDRLARKCGEHGLTIGERKERTSSMNRTRPKQIVIRVSEEELAQIKEKVEQSGKSQQQYIIEALTQSNIVNLDGLKEIYPELKRQGNNLNQIAKKLNENGYVDYKQELPNTMKEVREVWQLLKQYLQKQA